MSKATEIIISGQAVKVPDDEVSYDDIVRLWNKLHEDEGIHIVGTPGIDYRDGAKDDKGILRPGESVGVKDGTSFSVDPQHVS